MATTNTHKCLADALAAAQAELKDPKKTKTAKAGTYSYAYTDIAGVLAAVRPVLGKHGIAITQGISSDDGRLLKVTTSLLFGTEREFSSLAFDMPRDPQKLGSAITYLRRYTLSALVGVAADADDDGAHARPDNQQRREDPPRAAAVPFGSERAQKAWFAWCKQLGLDYEKTIKPYCAAKDGWDRPSTWPLENQQHFMRAVDSGEHPDLYDPRGNP